ncbi:DUF4157 domain-containing protein [Streptomyces sp. NPDC001941]|uniref:eCIS core domain-containing protein n=1 Tax=Streptomyces sp. NPDC001941 TaxID=3154659 RepID=UPI00332F530C
MPPAGAGFAPGEAQALQQSIGNAAVARALQRRMRRPEPDSGHGEASADVGAAVSDVLGSRGRHLPEKVQRDAETRLGTPKGTYRDVELHDTDTDREVARSVGAIALTSGNHIVGDVSRPQTFYHELHHIWQQKRGTVPGTDMGNGLRLSDARDSAEREAESVGNRAAAAPVQRAVTEPHLDSHPDSHPDSHLDSPSESHAHASPHSVAEQHAEETAAEPSPGALSLPIQRKVGFEFESNMLVKADDKAVIAKDEKVFEADSGDWYITPDASALEFVTVPFEEEGENPEWERMKRAVSEMADAFSAIHTTARLSQLMGGDTPLHEALSDGTVHQHAGHDVYVPGENRLMPPTAAPQATGGVSLERMLALFDALMKTQLPVESPTNPEDVAILDEEPEERTDKTPLAGADPRRDAKILADAQHLTAAYVEDLPDTGTGALEGLLALIYTYLLAGERQSRQQDQAKYFLPVMTRMSFSAMFASLPDEAKAAFDPRKVLSHGGFEPDEPVYKQGFSDRGAGDATTSRGPGRAAWLESITSGGPDLMSAGGGSEVTEGMKASSPAMGQHDALDAGHGSGAPGLAQVELRRLPKSVPPGEWLPVASTLFEMFGAVQNGRK